MRVSDFNSLLMTTRVVFQDKLIKPGSIIKVYKVSQGDTLESSLQPFTRGVVVDNDHIMIRYSYYSKSKGDMQSAYLYASDVFLQQSTDEQWEGKESLYLFEIEG